jgi:hypothetical protein
MESKEHINMITEKGIEKALSYSEKPEELKALFDSGIVMQYQFIGIRKYWPEDKEARQVLKITIARNGKSINFEFGCSINDTDLFLDLYKNPPQGIHSKVSELAKTWRQESFQIIMGKKLKDAINKGRAEFADDILYSILACIQSDFYTPDTFSDFCSVFCCDEDSKKAEKTYYALLEQSNKLRKIFTEAEIESFPS